MQEWSLMQKQGHRGPCWREVNPCETASLLSVVTCEAVSDYMEKHNLTCSSLSSPLLMVIRMTDNTLT